MQLLTRLRGAFVTRFEGNSLKAVLRPARCLRTRLTRFAGQFKGNDERLCQDLWQTLTMADLTLYLVTIGALPFS